MKIRSLTDVITNSSTEVFSMTTQKSVEDLKRMINLLLEVGDSSKTCDDLFDIYLIPGMWAKDEYESDGESWEELTTEEQVDWCLKNADCCDRTYLFPKVKIVPKSSDISDELLDFLRSSVDLGLTPVDVTFG